MSRKHANESSELSHYTEKGRLRSVLRWRRAQGAEQKPWWVRYELTPEGNLQGVWDGQRPKQLHYTLDRAQRLVGESYGLGERAEWKEEYRLDSAGNLVEKPGLRGVVLARGNRLAQANGEVFAYNTRHHVSERGRPGQQPTRYHYDSVDMLVRVEDGKGEPWTAEYDALHRRVRSGRGARQTEYYWDGDRLAAELSPEGRLRVYVYAAEDSLVPLLLVDYSGVDATAESGHVYTLYTDQSGTPTHVEDSSGRTVWWAVRVEPYGQVHVHPGSELELCLRWPGHYADPDSGLYFHT